MRRVYSVTSYVLYCVAILLFVPSLRTIQLTHWIGNDPQLNNFVSRGVADLEIDKISVAAKSSMGGSPQQWFSLYDPKQHLESERSLLRLEKETDRDYHCPRAETEESLQYCKREAAETLRITARIQAKRQELNELFASQDNPWHPYGKVWQTEYAQLRAADPTIKRYEQYETEHSYWDLGPLGIHIVSMYLWTLVLAGMMYWSTALARDIGLSQFLLLMDRTALAIIFWPVMFWRMHRIDMRQIARLAMRRVAMVASFFFTVALPNVALAQSQKVKEKKINPEYALVTDTSDQPAQSDPPAVKVSFSTGLMNQYIPRIGAVAHDEPVLQTDLNISFRSGWFVDLWSSTGFDTHANFGKELDYTIGHASRNWSVGVDLIDLSPQFSAVGGEMIDSYIEGHMSLGSGLVAFGQLDRFDVTSNYRKNSASVFAAGIKHNWQYGRFSAAEEAGLLYDTGTFGFRSSIVERLKASLSFALNKRWTLTPAQFTLSAPDRNSQRGMHLAYGAGLSIH